MTSTELQRELELMAPLLTALAGCPQHHAWHAEGDVAVHTRMVREALESIPAFVALPESEQNILRLAAALHDVGKPDTTRMEDGIWRSPGHGRRGAELVWGRWWRHGYRMPPEERAQVLALVRYHGRPLHTRIDLECDVIATSAVVNCHHLSILAEADMRGRICPGRDQEDGLLHLELFREAAREMGCLTSPYSWPSSHARFRFHGNGAKDRHHQAFDDRSFDVHLTVGLPGSGKTRFARSLGLPIVSRDDLREASDYDARDKGDQGRTHQLFKQTLKTHLRLRGPLVVDGTNLIRQLRHNTIDLCANYGAAVHLHLFDRDRATVLRQNLDREAVVPEAVIDRMATRVEWPDATEAHSITLH